MPDATPDKPKMDFSKLEQYSKESEWRMRNLDGIEYGPYSWEQLLQFAKEGRVSISSELQNAISTKGKWVRTERVKAIAALLALNNRPAPSVTAPPASPLFDVISQALELIPPAIAHRPTENILFDATSQSIRPSYSAINNNSTSFFDILDWRFKRYATPWVIRILWLVFVVFWVLNSVIGIVLLVFVIATGSWNLFSGEKPQNAASFSLAGVVILFLFVVFQLTAFLVVRIHCESFIVQFDISNSLKRLAGKPNP